MLAKSIISRVRNEHRHSSDSDRYIDLWIEQQLSDLHKDILDKPLPPNLEALARALDEKLKKKRQIKTPGSS